VDQEIRSFESKLSKADLTVTGIANALREAIIFGRYKPRERLVEEELTERYGATRHIIRNAFAELDHMGLVERRPNKGVIVRDFSLEELDELYDMRILLQTEAARRIPLPADPDYLAELRELNDAYHAAITAGHTDESCKINTRFHETLFAACGNRFLAAAINQYWIRTSPIHWYVLGDLNYLLNSYRDHEAMIAALAEGDRERLAEVCRKHIVPALDAYKRVHGPVLR
jgi:DNA-binding GntR family transcriptional regulator